MKDIKLEIFDFDMHDFWTREYQIKETYEWMLNQHK